MKKKLIFIFKNEVESWIIKVDIGFVKVGVEIKQKGFY